MIMEQRAIFSTSIAKRIPTQLRGPIPNPMKAYGLRLALFSGLHLKNESKFIYVDDSCNSFLVAVKTFQDQIFQDQGSILPYDVERKLEQ